MEEAGLGSFLWGAIHLHQLQFGGPSGVVVFSHCLVFLSSFVLDVLLYHFFEWRSWFSCFRSPTQLKDLSARSPWLGVIISCIRMPYRTYTVTLHSSQYLTIFHNTSHHASCMLHFLSFLDSSLARSHLTWDSRSLLPAQDTYACLGDLVKHSVYPAAQVLHLGNKMNLWDWDRILRRILRFPQSGSLYICSLSDDV